jgi:hypothetical protein
VGTDEAVITNRDFADDEPAVLDAIAEQLGFRSDTRVVTDRD